MGKGSPALHCHSSTNKRPSSTCLLKPERRNSNRRYRRLNADNNTIWRLQNYARSAEHLCAKDCDHRRPFPHFTPWFMVVTFLMKKTAACSRSFRHDCPKEALRGKTQHVYDCQETLADCSKTGRGGSPIAR